MRYHAFLLSGRGRLDAYARAIAAVVRPGDHVIDLGTGTGVLALLAARAGATQVLAVEDTPALELARVFTQTNGLDDRVVVVPRPSTRVTVSRRADVLVSDAYDTFGLQGGMLGSMLDARDRLLVAGARLIPFAIGLYVAPLEAPAEFEALVTPWGTEVLGLDFGAGRQYAVNGVQPATIAPDQLLGEPEQWALIDLRTAESLTVAGEVSLPIARDGELHGLAGWFEASLADGVSVSNAPGSQSTPYLQAWLPLAEATPVQAGETVTARVETDDGASWRWEVSVGDRARFEHSTDRGFPGLPSSPSAP